jgi:hypothetical protein
VLDLLNINKNNSDQLISCFGNRFSTGEIQKSEEHKNCQSFITQNRFLDLSWEIIYEDVSSFCSNINSVKILMKISILDIGLLEKQSINLVFDEKKFEVNNFN